MCVHLYQINTEPCRCRRRGEGGSLGEALHNMAAEERHAILIIYWQ